MAGKEVVEVNIHVVGIDLPEEPEARVFDPDPESMINPIRE